MKQSKHFTLSLAQDALRKSNRLVPFSINKRHTPTARQYLLFHCVRNKVPRHIKHQIDDMQLRADYFSYANEDKKVRFRNIKGKTYTRSLNEFSWWLEGKENKRGRDRFHQDGSFRIRLHDLENSAKNSVKYSMGNCYELSDVVLNLLLEMECKARVSMEKVRFTGNADHCFVVLNRDLSGDIRDIRSWGKGAVICDPWAGRVFDVAHELRRRSYSMSMFDYICKNLRDEKEPLNIEYLDYVGSGHSSRWKRKERPDLNSTPDYQDPKENIPFVRF